MKAYSLEKVGKLEYREIPMPKLKSGWALIRVEAAGICGSDLPRIFKTGTYHFPTIPGHEFAGTVVKVYDDKDAAWIGKRAGVFPLIPCMKCSVCQKGQYEMCRHYDYLGSRRDGGFAEYAAVPAWNLIEIPDEMGIQEAAMLEPAAVALHALRRINVGPEDTVALFGLGTIGILITQWLHIFGVKKVYAVGHNLGHGEMMRLTASKDYEYRTAGRPDGILKENVGTKDDAVQDAAAWILESTGGIGVSVAIDCAGTPETLTNCLHCVKPGGQVLAVGNPKGDMVLGKDVYWKILRNQIRLTGTWNSSFFHSKEDDWHMVIEACMAKKLHLLDLITHRFGFGELCQGLELAKERLEYHNKIMICSVEEDFLKKNRQDADI